jgi:hypothetical protein
LPRSTVRQMARNNTRERSLAGPLDSWAGS